MSGKYVCNDMPGRDAIFICASLEGENERQRLFSRNFQDRGLFKFVESIDGRHWAEDEADVHVSKSMREVREKERAKGKRWISAAAVACALTHRDRLLPEAMDRDVVLCEDDVSINRDFIDLWSKPDIREAFRQIDGVVLMYYWSRAPITSQGEAVLRLGEYSVRRLDDLHILAAACYYVPPAVAERIREFQTPLHCTADHWHEMRRNGVFRDIYAIHPAPANTGSLTSNIGYGGKITSNSLFFRLLRTLRRGLAKRRKEIYESIEVVE